MPSKELRGRYCNVWVLQYNVPGYKELRMVSTQEAMNVLLNAELSDSQICTRVLFNVEVNALFVVDLNQLSSPNYND